MNRLYRVCFDTQRDRRYITWGFWVYAKNQRDAKEIAFLRWNSSENPNYRNVDKPHMFHTDASRFSEEDRDRDIMHFFKIEDRYASWGKRKYY